MGTWTQTCIPLAVFLHPSTNVECQICVQVFLLKSYAGDIYACGCVVYEISYRLPLISRTDMAKLGQSRTASSAACFTNFLQNLSTISVYGQKCSSSSSWLFRRRTNVRRHVRARLYGRYGRTQEYASDAIGGGECVEDQVGFCIMRIWIICVLIGWRQKAALWMRWSKRWRTMRMIWSELWANARRNSRRRNGGQMICCRRYCSPSKKVKNCQMLPPSVARLLKAGTPVRTETVQRCECAVHGHCQLYEHELAEYAVASDHAAQWTVHTVRHDCQCARRLQGAVKQARLPESDSGGNRRRLLRDCEWTAGSRSAITPRKWPT